MLKCGSSLKVQTDKNKVMVFEGEEGLVCEVRAAGRQPDDISKFKYLRFGLDESRTDGVEFSLKFRVGRKVVGAMISLVEARRLRLKNTSLLRERAYL